MNYLFSQWGVHIYAIPVPFISTINMAHLSHLINQYQQVIFNQSVYIFSPDFLSFYLMPQDRFLSQDLFQNPVLHLVIRPPWAPLGAVTLSQTFLDFGDLDSCLILARYFVEFPSVRVLFFFDAFLMIRLALCIFGRNTAGVKCPSHCIHCIQGTCSQHASLLLKLTLITWQRSVCQVSPLGRKGLCGANNLALFIHLFMISSI